MRARRPRLLEPLAVFALLLAVYLANGGFLVGNDSTPNVFLPLSLLREGDVSFTPREVPAFFDWSYVGPGGPERVAVPALDARIHGRPAAELLERGELELRRVPYFLAPTRQGGVYVGTYGPAPGLAALPLFAALELFAGALDARPALLWLAAKLVAAALVAASAAFVWLAARRLASPRDAWLAALCYGLGTGVWSTASQALWQQSPAVFCVALGAWLLLELGAPGRDARGRAFACGLAWGAAAACRPTDALFAVASGGFVAWRQRRLAAPFAAGVALCAAPLLLFNQHYFGAPFETGQAILNRAVAQRDTGTDLPFQLDLWEGLFGLLVSPSRGLLVYSPVVLLALVGLRQGWRRPDFAALKPLCLAAALIFLAHASFVRWWGGWSFGPRYLLDLMPIAALCIAPGLPALRARRAGYALALTLLALSAGVQAVGAFAYDVDGWNDRRALVLRSDPSQRILLGPGAPARADAARGAYRLARLDVDEPENRARLWSLVDSPLVYYVRYFESSRRERERGIRSWLQQSPRLESAARRR